MADSTFHEGLEFADVAIKTARKLGQPEMLRPVVSILNRMKETAAGWREYHAMLPPERRSTVSDDSRRLILSIPAIDSLLKETEAILSGTDSREDVSAKASTPTSQN